MSGNNGSLEPMTAEDARQEIDWIEGLLDELGGEDEYLRAILHNQRIQLMDMATRLQGQPQTNMAAGLPVDVSPVPEGEMIRTQDIPLGAVGLANRYIQENDYGPATFQVQGTIFNDTVRATEDISPGDPVQVIAHGNIVRLRPNVSVSFFGLGAGGGSTAFEVEETDANNSVTISPGDTETVVTASMDGGTVVAVGTNDETFARYQYLLDGDELLDEPLAEPLGLYNDPFYFPQALSADRTFETEVTLLSGAAGSKDFYSKVIYIE